MLRRANKLLLLLLASGARSEFERLLRDGQMVTMFLYVGAPSKAPASRIMHTYAHERAHTHTTTYSRTLS